MSVNQPFITLLKQKTIFLKKNLVENKKRYYLYLTVLDYLSM